MHTHTQLSHDYFVSTLDVTHMIKYARLSSFLAGRTWIQGSLSVVYNSFLKVFIYFMTAHLTHFVVTVYGMLWFTVAMNFLVVSNFCQRT